MNIKDIQTVELAKIYRKLDYPLRRDSRRDHERIHLLDKVMEELTLRARVATRQVK